MAIRKFCSIAAGLLTVLGLFWQGCAGGSYSNELFLKADEEKENYDKAEAEEQTAEDDSQVDESEENDYAIPDASPSGLVIKKIVAENFIAEKVRVLLDLTHPDVSELTAALISPAGTSVFVKNLGGESAAYLHINRVLSNFGGESSVGEWTLVIKDYKQGNIGEVNNFDIDFIFSQEGDEDSEETDALESDDRERKLTWIMIPDNDPNGADFYFTIDEDAEAAFMAIELKIVHYFQGDLKISLYSPRNNETPLIIWRPLPERAAAIEMPLIASFKPAVQVSGTWTVNIADTAKGDIGRAAFVSVHYWSEGADVDFDFAESAEDDEVAEEEEEAETGAQIPDESTEGLIYNLFVAEDAPATAVYAKVLFSHPRQADLVLTMTSPSGKKAKLSSQYFNEDGYAVYAAAQLIGENALGLWTMIISDVRAGMTGVVWDAAIIIETIIAVDGDITEEPLEEDGEGSDEQAQDDEPQIDTTEEGLLWIPDNYPAGLSLVFENETELTPYLCVELKVVHTFPGDLAAEVVSPQGNKYPLFETDANRPYPDMSFSAVINVSDVLQTAGKWTLIVKDLAAGDVGYVDEWKFDFACSPQIDGDWEEAAQETDAERDDEEIKETEPEAEELAALIGGTCASPLELPIPFYGNVKFPQDAQNELTAPTQCLEWPLDGRETALKFTANSLKPIYFNLFSQRDDFGFYLLKSCGDAASCLAGSDSFGAGSSEFIGFKPPEPGDYYLIVDTVAGQFVDENTQFQLMASSCLSQELSSPNTPIVIPDATSATALVSIPVGFPIDKMSVEYDINHENIGDLKIVLTTPWNANRTLRDREGGEDRAVVSKPLWEYHGQNSKGVWQLKVTDESYFDAGTLLGFKLRFYCEPLISGCDPQSADAQCNGEPYDNRNNAYCKSREVEIPFASEGYACSKTNSPEGGDYYSFWAKSPEKIEISLYKTAGDDVSLYIYKYSAASISRITSITGSNNPKTYILSASGTTHSYYFVKAAVIFQNEESNYRLEMNYLSASDGDAEKETETSEENEQSGEKDETTPEIEATDDEGEIIGDDIETSVEDDAETTAEDEAEGYEGYEFAYCANPPGPATCADDDFHNLNSTYCRAAYVPIPFYMDAGYVCKPGSSVNDAQPDWFAFDASDGKKIKITMTASSGDVDLLLYRNPEETVLESSTSSSEIKTITRLADASGIYFLKVIPYTVYSTLQYGLSITFEP